MLIERKPMQKAYEREFETAWDTFLRINQRHKASKAVYVKRVSVTEGNTYVLCLSEGRARKELAMDEQVEQRVLKAMERLQRSVTKGALLSLKWWDSMMAYHLLTVMERQLREAGDTRRWPTIQNI